MRRCSLLDLLPSQVGPVSPWGQAVSGQYTLLLLPVTDIVIKSATKKGSGIPNEASGESHNPNQQVPTQNKQGDEVGNRSAVSATQGSSEASSQQSGAGGDDEPPH